MIHYKITPVFPQAHLFEVELRIPDPAPDGQHLNLPAWIPGSYMIRDFAKNIVEIEAWSKDVELILEKLDKQTWLCQPCTAALLIRYKVYAWDLSVRGAHLDTTHGYFNGTSVFLRVVGQDDQPSRVEIVPPAGEAYHHWRVATTLPSVGAEPMAFGFYQATDYVDLIDHPVEIGNFAFAKFSAAGKPHEVTISGRHSADMDRICADLKRICETHSRLFGELPDIERYLFQVMAVGEGYGGLEHRSSTSLICNRTDLPRIGDKNITEGYKKFLGLCSHEYFHLWNVKRIQPALFRLADLLTETHTRLLWAFEGITSYYDDLALVRSGLIEPNDYLELLAQVITRVMRGSGRLKQTVAESSFDAWTRFYKQDENAPNAIVSYYTKGSLIALVLDLTIRRETADGRSLDDVMKTLWQRYGSRGIGLAEDEIERVAEEVSGVRLKPLFDLALRTTRDLPLQGLLNEFGIGFTLGPAKSVDDKGGLRKAVEKLAEPRPVLGAVSKPKGQDVELTVVLDDSAAQQAGLAAGDVIVAVDGIRVTQFTIHDQIAHIPPGESVNVHLFRRDELMQFELTPKPAPADTCRLWLLEEIDPTTRKMREEWLQPEQT